jgi:hypothetical protein
MSGYSVEVIDGKGATLTAVVTLLQLHTGQIEWRAVLWSDSCPLRIMEGQSSDAGAVEDDLRRLASLASET